MDNNLFLRHNLLAILLHQFLMGSSAMKACGNQDGNINLRICLTDSSQQDRHCHMARHRPGVVAGNDDHGLLALDQLLQGLAANGIIQGALHDLLLRSLHAAACRIRLQHPLEILVRNLNIHPNFVIRNFQLHKRHFPLLLPFTPQLLSQLRII